MVEQPVEAVLIPDNVFRDWVERYALWREFTFSLLSLRLTSVLTLVEDIVFRRMDARCRFLLATTLPDREPHFCDPSRNRC